MFTKSCDSGGLLYLSTTLFTFVSDLEDKFTGSFGTQKLHHSSVMDVLAVVNSKNMSGVGCGEHSKSLTVNLIGFPYNKDALLHEVNEQVS